MVPNKGTAELMEANERAPDRRKKPPQILMFKLPLRRAGEGDDWPGGTHSPLAVFAAPQNRHKTAASWISSAQNRQFTMISSSGQQLLRRFGCLT